MINIQVISCDLQHLKRIQSLAVSIWRPTFSPILSADRLDYLFHFMYNQKKLKMQLTAVNHRFFLLNDGVKDIGYAQLVIQLPKIKLEKLYISQNEQGKGVGLYFLKYLFNISKRLGGKYLDLQVNRGNKKAIDFYLKFGFIIEKSEDFDVGDGHVMDDFVMSCALK